MRLRPSEVLFTQDSIGGRFQDRVYLTETFEELLYRRITPDEIEPIEVVLRRGIWWALTGNRRLYLYKKLQPLGIVQTIPVVERFETEPGVMYQLQRRMTTDTNGKTIKCRQSQADVMINNIIDRWKMPRNTSNANCRPLYTESTVDSMDNIPNHSVSQTPMADLLKSRRFGETGVNPHISDARISFERLGNIITQIDFEPETKSESVLRDRPIRSTCDLTTASDQVPRTFSQLSSLDASFAFKEDIYQQGFIKPGYALPSSHMTRQQPQISTNETK